MSPSCKIVFDNNPKKIFYSGKSIVGEVVILTMEELRIRKAEITAEGVGQCAWEDTLIKKEGVNYEYEHITFKGNKNLLNVSQELISAETYISPGRHSYNFTLEIPADTPSSIEEKLGSVKYKVRVSFDRIIEPDFNCEADIKIIRPIDLNWNPTLKLPCEQEKFADFCTLFFCITKPLHFILKIHKTGFVPGEILKVEARVINPTSVVILNLNFSLVKRTIYKSSQPHSKTKYEDNVVYQMNKGTPMSNCRRDYIAKFKVPDLPASTISQSSSVVNVKYFLSVTAKASGCNSSPVLEIPLTLGTIPIIWTSNRQTEPRDDPPKYLPSAPTIEVAAPSAPLYCHATCPESPPPSFEEAMKVSTSATTFLYPQLDQL